jgi:hypothetical protein
VECKNRLYEYKNGNFKIDGHSHKVVQKEGEIFSK